MVQFVQSAQVTGHGPARPGGLRIAIYTKRLTVLCIVFLLALSCGAGASAFSDEDAADEVEDIDALSDALLDEAADDYTETVIPEVEVEAEASPFTPDGTGTAVDSATDEDGKEFYTITTEAGNVFYLIIDHQRSSDNVYFLNAVTENDLLALAEPSPDTSESAIDETETAPVVTPDPELEAELEDAPEDAPTEQEESTLGTLLLVLAVVGIGGGAGYYFKIYRPKHEAAPDGGEYEDYEGEAGVDHYGDYDYSDNGEQEGNAVPWDVDGPEDDSPPWDDDDGGEQEDDEDGEGAND